jgi:hypothetical protein
VSPMATPVTERTQCTCVCWGLFEPSPETARADPHSLRNSGRFQEGDGERKKSRGRSPVPPTGAIIEPHTDKCLVI